MQAIPGRASSGSLEALQRISDPVLDEARARMLRRKRQRRNSSHASGRVLARRLKIESAKRELFPEVYDVNKEDFKDVSEMDVQFLLCSEDSVSVYADSSDDEGFESGSEVES